MMDHSGRATGLGRIRRRRPDGTWEFANTLEVDEQNERTAIQILPPEDKPLAKQISATSRHYRRAAERRRARCRLTVPMTALRRTSRSPRPREHRGRSRRQTRAGPSDAGPSDDGGGDGPHPAVRSGRALPFWWLSERLT